jgi:hypothetical protein
LDQVLAAWSEPESPTLVPAQSWITDRFDLPRDVVVGPSRPMRIAWADRHGQLVGESSPALYQHLFGPQIPAFSVKTPAAPGDYRLVFLDEHRRPVKSRPYRVHLGLETIVSRVVSGKDDLDAGELVSATLVSAHEGHAQAFILENKSRYYLQANTSRDQVYLKSARIHPGTLGTSSGSLVLMIRPAAVDRAQAQELAVLMPCDLPPQSRVKLTFPVDLRSPGEPPSNYRVSPHFLR